jgi:hypothetical protein
MIKSESNFRVMEKSHTADYITQFLGLNNAFDTTCESGNQCGLLITFLQLQLKLSPLT